ncbi:MAG: type II toxin-antitoxin system HicA family toxin [Patescibacteria group bacterium]
MKWRAVKGSKVLRALFDLGWVIKRQRGSHKILGKIGYSDFTFAFNDRDEIGPKMLARIAKHTGLGPDSL